MCSVVGGVIHPEIWMKRKDQLRELISIALTRKGYDGFTCNIWLNDGSAYRTASFNPNYIVDTLDTVLSTEVSPDDIPPRVGFMLFGRAAPETEVQTSNVQQLQPFSTVVQPQSNGCFSIHHGLVSNYQELVDSYSVDVKTSIDSEVIPWVIDTMANEKQLDNFSKIVKGSHSILYVRDGLMGYINNYLGLWGINLNGEFHIGQPNKDFILYNTDLKSLFNDQFELPLYSQAIIGGINE